MAYLKAGIFVLACFVFINAQAFPARCPKKCGKVRKLVNNLVECGCASLEPTYSMLAELPKCGCGKSYLDSGDICGCKIPNIDSQLVGIIDYITGIVETKCGCQVTPCGCQVTPCGCQVKPCGCQVTPCGCQVKPCGCQVTPCGCQQTVRIPNNYDVLSAIEIPRCGPVVNLAYATPAIEACGKCSKIDCNCRNQPYEVITASLSGCLSPVVDVPAYVYSVQPPVVEVMPFQCGCGMQKCGCGFAQVEPCSCGVLNCGCVGPCICGTGSCGCGNPNCGCLSVCSCGIPECNCVSPCACGVPNCGCVGSCGCVGPCGCGNSECGCRKYLRKTSIPPPFL